MTIAWDFIGTLEGESVLTGYVPDAANSQSGVTVATGVDLGQIDAAKLAGLAVPPGLKKRLGPYLGLKRQAAAAVLAAQPLTITAAESDQLDQAIRAPIVAALQAAYAKAAGVAFDTLPDAVQTVLASVAFQYGPALATRTPSFWKHAVDQDWPALRHELENFDDRYPTRRHKEAAYLATSGTTA